MVRRGFGRMSTPPPLSRGRRANLVAAALEQYQAGKSERDALDDVLAGKPIQNADRESIEAALAALIASGETPEPSAPDLAVVPSVPADDGSLEPEDLDGPEIPEPPTPGPEAPKKGARRTAAQRLADAKAELVAALDEVLRIQLVILAHELQSHPASKRAGGMVAAAIANGYPDDAVPYAHQGLDAVIAASTADETVGVDSAVRRIGGLLAQVEALRANPAQVER